MESLLPSLDSFKHSTERGLCLSLASEQLGNPARMKVGATAAWARRQPPERHRVPTIAAPKLDGPTQGRCPPEPYLERYSSRPQFLARKLDRSLNPGAATNQASRFPARAPAAWPLLARAQQPERMRRIGVLLPDHAANAERTDTIACSRGGIGRAPRSEVSKARDRSGPRSAGSTR
jgi:hypothetical protein